jgi:hypothetical protein
MSKNLNVTRKAVIFAFILVPLLSATISAFHLERFLALGNPSYISWSTAFTYELANVSALLVFVVLPKINKLFVWTSFVILICMQIIGNIYYSFNFIYEQQSEHAVWIDNYLKMIKVLSEDFPRDGALFWLSVIIGAPVPLIALLLTKSISDYLGDNKKDDKTGVVVEPTENQKKDSSEEIHKGDENQGVVVRT